MNRWKIRLADVVRIKFDALKLTDWQSKILARMLKYSEGGIR